MTSLDAAALVADLRRVFDRGTTAPLLWRQRQLDGLVALLTEGEEELVAALYADLGKSADEAFTTEIGFTLQGVRHLQRGLRGWLRPRRSWPGLALAPAQAWTMLEPLGVVLVIAPWNYPLHLTLAPLAGALAAGNAVVVKPSELAPATSATLARLLPQYLDRNAVRVVEGAAEETGVLLAERFDHVFFTGGERVAHIVAEAAAKHLTPTTLELGGKSPVFVDSGVDLDVVARRLAWGKFTNAGQTCTAPDYVLATPAVAEALAARLEATVREFFGADPQRSGDFGRIVNERHLERLRGLLGSGRAQFGGKVDVADRYLAPTVLREVAPDSPVMSEEIFGPILPILEVADAAEAIAFIRARPKPLALYVFSERREVQQAFLRRVSSGGVGINLTLAQITAPELPFGGVGASGMGAYHGEHSVRVFSHEKSVVRKPTAPDTMGLVYPPVAERTRALLRRILR